MIRIARPWIFAGLFAVIVLSVAGLSATKDAIVFDDVEAQTRQFMDWERRIRLTPEQEAVKKDALTRMPAPCCDDNSAYTCCCSCNVSRTIWGLSNYLIAKQGADVNIVEKRVNEWITFVNPNGYSGKTCYTRGCSRAFKHDGCGGMRRGNVVF